MRKNILSKKYENKGNKQKIAAHGGHESGTHAKQKMTKTAPKAKEAVNKDHGKSTHAIKAKTRTQKNKRHPRTQEAVE